MEREHGTYAKYVTDSCRCDECRAANAAYSRQRRADSEAVREYDRKQKVAYYEAERRLRERFRAEFDRLYAEERRRVGLDVERAAAS